MTDMDTPLYIGERMVETSRGQMTLVDAIAHLHNTAKVRRDNAIDHADNEAAMYHQGKADAWSEAITLLNTVSQGDPVPFPLYIY